MNQNSLPLKEDIIEYYIHENNSRQDTAEYFHIKENTLRYLLKQYGIKKDMTNAAKVAKKTFEKKYGVDSYFKTEECNQKLQQTCLEKYGVEHYSQADEIKKKTQQTCLKKYGVEAYVQTQDFKDKSKKTCLEKYGKEFVCQTEEHKQKTKNTCMKKYGVKNWNQKDINNYNFWQDENSFVLYLKSLPAKPTLKEISNFFNVDESAIHARFNKDIIDKYIDLFPRRSKYEDELIEFLRSLNIHDIQTNVKNILDKREIDIYLPEYHLGIEFNGSYWHSDIFHTDHKGRSTYHQEKSLKAEEVGIFLFHIFEYEWNNLITRQNILNRLKTILCQNNNKISARKCRIINLTKEQKKDFLNINHIQGNDHSTIYLGLEYSGQIVSCMTFVHPKNNKYTWELSRFCNLHGYCVRGGASKLFKYFVDQLKAGDTISSYNDITKTKGDIYKILGFQCVSINQPNYVWINFNTSDIRTRYQEQTAGEVKRMHDAGYHRICDCGTKTWVYTKQ